MVRSEREMLSGIVEVDETLVGGVDKGGKRGRGSQKSIVVIAIEVHESKDFGRVRMRYIPDASSKSLTDFINDVVWFIQAALFVLMGGADIMVWNLLVIIMKSQLYLLLKIPLMFLCLEFTILLHS